MNKKEKAYLEEIYRDCVNLEKKNDLTEHGAGEGDLCEFYIKEQCKIF